LTFADIYLDNIDETTGELNQAQMEADWADFTAGVAKLSDLEEQIGLLNDQMAPIVANPNFILDDPDQPTAEYVALAAQLRDLGKRIKPLRQQYAAISAVYKERAAKRKAKAAKSTTQTPVPAGVQ